MFRNRLRRLVALIPILVIVFSMFVIDRASSEGPTAPSASVEGDTATYTNPAGLIENLCNGKVGVTASNQPYRDQFEGLQPVKFIVTSVSKNGGHVHVLGSFILPSHHQNGEYFDTAYHTYKVNGPSVVSLQVDGKDITPRLHYTHPCTKQAQPYPTVLPNTGK